MNLHRRLLKLEKQKAPKHQPVVFVQRDGNPIPEDIAQNPYALIARVRRSDQEWTTAR